MNQILLDPFYSLQDYPESLANDLRSGHSTTLRFNYKGDIIAAGRLDGVIVLFDVETNSTARKLRGHVRQVQYLNWSRDGRYLMSCAQDYKIIRWDLAAIDGAPREVRMNAPVYCSEMHPENLDLWVCSLYDDKPHVVDVSLPRKSVKHELMSAPKRPESEQTEKTLTQDAQQKTTATVFTADGAFILAGTNKGWINIIDISTRDIIYSTRLTTGCITYLRISLSGRHLAINSSDRIVRSVILPENLRKGVDPESISLEVEHKFQDVVNKLLWNHVTLSGSGDYICASTFHNHDIYIWERDAGVLCKILEGPKEELGCVEWHPTRPVVAAVGLETGRIYIWATTQPQRWSALAPDFQEVEENVEYEEREDEFDIHAADDVKKRRLHLETEKVDVKSAWKVGRVEVEEKGWQMPVYWDDDAESESEEENVRIEIRGKVRKDSPVPVDGVRKKRRRD